MVRCRDMCFPRVDADNCSFGMVADFFAQVADGGNGGTDAEFYDYHVALAVLVQKGFKAVFLGAVALVEPGVVVKHQDVGAGDTLGG